MKNKSLVILVSTIVGVCAALFGAWHLYRQRAAADAGKDFFLDATPEWFTRPFSRRSAATTTLTPKTFFEAER